MKNVYTFFVVLFALCATKSFAQVPTLNSYPSASAAIFLDFDGHTVNGTSWNTSGPIFAGPSNMNAAQITEVFNRIAEDYRPFNINVTTDSTKYLAAPVKQRMRVIMTITWEWYGRAGGVAYTNSFTWGDNTPCFVFTSLHNYNTKNIAEAGAHEAGHTLGLRHQARYDDACSKTEDYHSGIGSGETGWAPIMGVGYYRNLTTWHNGSNPYGCTNVQDDLSIITSKTNGFGYRISTKTSTFTNATPIELNDNKLAASGVITTSTDVNFFKISLTKTSPIKLKATPYSAAPGDDGSNLDVEMKLYNGSKQLINTYNQPEMLSASLDTTLSSGSYYLEVTGVGNQYTSDYASLGAYSIDGTAGEYTVLPLRKLDIRGTTDGNKHKLAWTIDADETIVKQTLEVSSNGRNFEPVALPAADARSYAYTPASNSVLQYRVSVTFDNGRQHYSNVIALRNNLTAAKPQLFTNIIRSNAIMVNSPAVFTFAVTDLNGKLLSKGQVPQGSATINTGNLTNGMYFVRFSNGTEQYVEKFIKQ